MVVARTPFLCGGYIQSLKCSASNGPSQRSAAGCAAVDQSVRQKCAKGSRTSRSSTSIPASASGITRLPDRRRRRERDDLVAMLGRHLGEAGQRAAEVVVDARAFVRQRADIEGDPHRE